MECRESHFLEISHFRTHFLEEGGWISIKERISPQFSVLPVDLWSFYGLKTKEVNQPSDL